tara:strand:+ start:42 stop:188 length:147 start_codon:yes stop_codon:yes gene_type:complete
MTKTITLTYTIDVEEMTNEKIEEVVYQAIDLGFGHCADLSDIDIGDDE